MFSTVPASVPTQVAGMYATVKTAPTNPLISNKSDLCKTKVGKQGDSVTISNFAEVLFTNQTAIA